MAKKITIDLEAKTDKAIEEIDALKDEVVKLNKQVSEGNNDTKKGLKGIEESSRSTAKGIKGIGTAIKAAGIGLLLAAMGKLKEVFEQNQKVADLFATSFEFISIAFNDFVNFIVNNTGVVVGFFKAIFQDPKQALTDFADAFKRNIQERFESYLDTLGYLASAVKKVFSGDFAGALEDVKSAGKESIDVLTGVNDSFDKGVEIVQKVTKATSDYVKETVKVAKTNVDLQKQSEIAIAQNRIILEQKDREAEKLRQIRDDESKTIEDRIEANNKLAEVLKEQERLMIANADVLLASAQAQYDKNQSQENYLALLDAQAEKEGILAQVEGFRSEQLTNVNSLEREKADLIKETEEEALDRAIFLAESKKNLENQAIADSIALVGANSKFGKAIATAQAIRDTYAGATKALAQGGIFGFISAAAITAAGLANVKTINSTKEPKAPSGFSTGSGGGSAAVTTPPAQPPQFNIVGAGGTNQLAEAIGSQEKQPVKAYVVSNDVTTAQSMDRNIVEGASI
jgi:hypothetical protein